MKNSIIWTVIFLMIAVPSWQIGSVLMEKTSVTYLLREHVAKAKKTNYSEKTAKANLKMDLERKGLPSEFTLEVLGRRKVKISYQYYGTATVFGYTYYQTSETLIAETSD